MVACKAPVLPVPCLLRTEAHDQSIHDRSQPLSYPVWLRGFTDPITPSVRFSVSVIPRAGGKIKIDSIMQALRKIGENAHGTAGRKLKLGS